MWQTATMQQKHRHPSSNCRRCYQQGHLWGEVGRDCSSARLSWLSGLSGYLCIWEGTWFLAQQGAPGWSELEMREGAEIQGLSHWRPPCGRRLKRLRRHCLRSGGTSGLMGTWCTRTITPQPFFFLSFRSTIMYHEEMCSRGTKRFHSEGNFE